MIIAAAAAALSFASCQKEQISENPSENQQINLDVTVADLLGSAADTKVGKSTWAAGDKINIWTLRNRSDITSGISPDLIITFDGSKWTAGSLNNGVELSNSGSFYCVYEGYNDISKYNIKAYSTCDCVMEAPKYGSSSIYALPLTATSSASYTYNSSAKSLEITISSWTIQTMFKVLIPSSSGIDMDATDWILAVKNTTKDAPAGTTSGIIYEGTVTPSIGSANNSGKALGVKESDGIAFYYKGLSYYVSSYPSKKDDVIQFSLSQGGGDAKTYTFTLTSDYDHNTYKGISIAYTKFE